MKKFLVTLLFCVVTMFTASNTGLATNYPDYLYGNPAIKIAWGHMDVGAYVDSTSVTSLIYNPPYYKLAANVIYYDARKNNVYKTETRYYEIDLAKQVVYITGENGRRMGPIHYNRNDLPSSSLRPLQEFLIVWKKAYGNA